MKKCDCKKILWIKIECKYCKKRRIRSYQQWYSNYTFVYGEQVLVSDDFIGKNIKATVVDEEYIQYSCYKNHRYDYTEIYYLLKLPDGNIKKFSRYNIKKIKE